MKIIYPYNEVLPLKRAHDAYIVRNCASLADLGHDVTLLCGRGSLPKDELFKFYNIKSDNLLKIVELPILRRQKKWGLQCNVLFFWMAQKYLEKHRPDVVLFSVIKQANFHLSRKIPGSQYIYEVHQLSWYPTSRGVNMQKVEKERALFNLSDALTVTTDALSDILKDEPYCVQVPIAKIPLACDFEPLRGKQEQQEAVQLYYVGQLYQAQGLKVLLETLKEVEGVHLTVIGGKPAEIEEYESLCEKEELTSKVTFRGFHSSNELAAVLKEADAFVTTFENVERMPYVAHTKIIEYQAWQKPIIAPKFKVVEEHLEKGAILYDSEDRGSLKKALYDIQSKEIYQQLAKEAKDSSHFTWEKRGCLFNKFLNKIQNPQRIHLV